MLKVLIVDDHQAVCAALQLLFELNGIDEGAALFRAIRELDPGDRADRLPRSLTSARAWPL